MKTQQLCEWVPVPSQPDRTRLQVESAVSHLAGTWEETNYESQNNRLFDQQETRGHRGLGRESVEVGCQLG